MSTPEDIIRNEDFTPENLISLLESDGEDRQKLFEFAQLVKKKEVGNVSYFRGLIEFSNICAKNCYYCGIRAGNKKTGRYFLTKEEVLEAAEFAWKNKYASLVMQSGERSDKKFTDVVTDLLQEITSRTRGELHITLSMGEQTEGIYRKWLEAGAHRYLLRIEASKRELYNKLHPNDRHHDYDKRLKALQLLRKIGYQVGTGVMIGLPFQSLEDLANDLLFFKAMDIDMVGMGPYIEHEDTPLYQHKDQLLPKEKRFDLSLKMVAILRIMMKDINIAATTAMQTLDPLGREKAIKVGANVIMPNLTPVKYRENYLLYEDKPCQDEEAEDCLNCLEARIQIAGDKIGYNEWGDSKHFRKRNTS